MISHRSGRWAFNQKYAQSLVNNGYKIDCSVTPLRSWKNTLGNPLGIGGTDYLAYSNKPYWYIKSPICNNNSILEIPVTIIS